MKRSCSVGLVDSVFCSVIARALKNKERYGNIEIENRGELYKHDGRNFAYWKASFESSPESVREIEVFYDFENDKIYLGRRKLGRKEIDISFLKEIIEDVVSMIPKDRLRWYTDQVLGGIEPPEQICEIFYSEREKEILKRWRRMLPILHKIFRDKKEREISEKQRELLQKLEPLIREMNREIERNPEKADEIRERYFKEFEKIEQEEGISEFLNPEDAVNTFLQAYTQEVKQKLDELEAWRKMFLRGEISGDKFDKIKRITDQDLSEIDKRYAEQWQELRRKIGKSAERFPESFSKLIFAYSR